MIYHLRHIALCILALMASSLIHGEIPHINLFTVVPETYALSNSTQPISSLPTYTLKTFTQRLYEGKDIPHARFLIDYPGDHTNIKKTVTIHQGIQSAPTDRIVIISRGRSPLIEHYPWMRWFGKSITSGSGMRKVRHFLQHDILPNAIFVIFDYSNDASSTHDFGYAAEQKRLEHVITWVHTKNPHARIALVGDCRGAHAVLQYLVAHPHDTTIDTVILESPYADLNEFLKNISHTHMSSYCGIYAQPILESIFNWHYPAYKESAFQQSIKQFPEQLTYIHGKKIFIGHHEHDHVISKKQINILTEKLSPHNDLYLFTSTDTAGHHSYLSPIPTFQQTLNAFCARYGLSHDILLAEQGNALLEKATVPSHLHSA